jgi:hypothetical protein
MGWWPIETSNLLVDRCGYFPCFTSAESFEWLRLWEFEYCNREGV